jgi:general secretion pathway protein G
MRRRRGFTLLELMISLAVLALLATIVLPIAQVEVQRTREHDLIRALRELRTAIDAYKKAYDEGHIEHHIGETGYPPTLQVLVDGVEDVRDPKKAKVFFLRAIPRDPMSPDSSIPDADTWAKRCYASEANDPQEGDDVYDVHSRSPKVGLNGVAYNRW